MAYTTGTAIQANGVINAVSDTDMTLAIKEMLVGTEYITFSTPKSVVITNTDFSTTALSDSEKAVAEKLAKAGGSAVILSQIELIAAASLATKLG